MIIALLVLIAIQLGLIIVLLAHLVPTPETTPLAVAAVEPEPPVRVKVSHDPITLFLLNKQATVVAERVIHDSVIPLEVLHGGRIYTKFAVERDSVMYRET